ncbi:MAG: aspartate aminotransferase family protein [Coriobacteriales bacterium]|jgi:acetylornithine/N-succinyldiaminopimelate aminotransferase
MGVLMTPDFEQEKKLEDKYVMHTYGRKPVEFVEGHGMKLYDTEGKEYLDFLAGIAVVGLGHSHPAVVAAMQEQAAKLVQTSNYYYVNGRGELAEKISGLMNAHIEDDSKKQDYKTFFCNSGAEANEGAFKLARRYSDAIGRKNAKTILFLRDSFHGRTLATIAATGQPSKQEIFKPLPDGFTQIEPNSIDSFLAALDDPATGEVCAVIVECIQGESGVNPCTAEYLEALREETEKRQILMIIDEVQTGFFRCGTYPFCFQRFGIVPDIVTMAKGIANGVPMGAFAARAEVADAFQPGDHGSTFGGNQFAISVSNATIDTLISEHLGENAEIVGEYLAERLSSLDMVELVRGMGLMRGAKLKKDIAPEVVSKGLEKGLVLNNPKKDVLRFVPPLICTKEDVDVMIERLAQIFDEIEA